MKIGYVIFTFSPENGKRSSFRNVVLCPEYLTMDELMKSSNIDSNKLYFTEVQVNWQPY